MNECGSVIYFDAHSSVGHPTSEKWIPLEFKNGLKTDLVHNCPNKKQQNGLVTAVTTAAAAATTTTNTSLSFAESLDQVLQDYIRLKRLELTTN